MNAACAASYDSERPSEEKASIILAQAIIKQHLLEAHVELEV